MTELLDTLEQQHGRIALWEWTREWLETADDEKISLEAHLCSRSLAEIGAC